MSGLPFALIGAAENQSELILSIIVWFVMVTKAVSMRRARKLNRYFGEEFT